MKNSPPHQVAAGSLLARPLGSSPFTFIDLFAGIGGFHRAMADLGGRCAMACEIDEDALKVYREVLKVYREQFPGPKVVKDIRSLTLDESKRDRPGAEIDRLVPDHEVLCAGFPCQPFSKSGFQEGVLDQTRGTLFFDLMQIIRAKSPTFVILENVRNLAGPRHRDTWSTIITLLRKERYCVASEPLIFSPHLLPAELGGAPQIRDRVFILGWKQHGRGRLKCPEAPLLSYGPAPGWDPMRWDIHSYLEPDESIENRHQYMLRAEEVGWLEAWNDFIQKIPADSLPGFPIWSDDFRLRSRIPPGTPDWKADFLHKNSKFYRENQAVIDRWLEKKWGPLKQSVGQFPPSRRKFEWQARSAQPTRADRNLWKLVIHFRPSGIRVKPPTYLPALVAITQTSVIGDRRRRITPREAALLQGFPPDIFRKAGASDATAYRQLGNAVNVGVVKYVASALFADYRREHSIGKGAERMRAVAS